MARASLPVRVVKTVNSRLNSSLSKLSVRGLSSTTRIAGDSADAGMSFMPLSIGGEDRQCRASWLEGLGGECLVHPKTETERPPHCWRNDASGRARPAAAAYIRDTPCSCRAPERSRHATPPRLLAPGRNRYRAPVPQPRPLWGVDSPP